MSLRSRWRRFVNLKLGQPERHTDLDEGELGGVPDLIEPLQAWRVWRISILPFNPHRIPLLRSVILDTRWTPRQEVAAEHSYDLGAKCRGLLKSSCSCGVYAFKDPRDAFTYLLSVRDRLLGMSVDTALGSVSLWGKVVECERGYRAQYAYPHHIYLPATAYHQVSDVSSEFGVPVGVHAALCGREAESAELAGQSGRWGKTPSLKKFRVLETRNRSYRIAFYDQQIIPNTRPTCF
ncbi:MAG TPA: hypothetical protein VMW54_13715 [Terriglobia bacterium]|nr:hypothetical protein [Terriglobia bacterium]